MQANYKASFEETLSTIYNVFKELIPLQVKDRVKDEERAIKLSELAPHLETLVEHIENYDQQVSCTSMTSSCFDFKSKKGLHGYENVVLSIKHAFLKALGAFYTTDKDPNLEKRNKIRKEMVKIKVRIITIASYLNHWSMEFNIFNRHICILVALRISTLVYSKWQKERI